MKSPEPLRIPDDNEENERKLIEYICSGESLLMVGAGCSKMVGYPLWGELIERLEDELKNVIGDMGGEFLFRKSAEEEDDLSYSDRMITALGDSRYHDFMAREFGPKTDGPTHSPTHIQLLELPFRGILTTNYDPTLEAALAEVNLGRNIRDLDSRIILDEGTSSSMILEFIKCLNHGNSGKRKIAYLHGYYKNGKSLVLGAKDYIEKYARLLPEQVKWPLYKRILWALMATRRLVYVGFSMTDPYFNFIHEIASKDFGMYHQDIHFLISSFHENDQKKAGQQLKFAERLKRTSGIQTIFFPDIEDYSGFPKYIESLNHRVNAALGNSDANKEGLRKTPNSSNPPSQVIKPPSMDPDPDQDEFYSATRSGSGSYREGKEFSEGNTRSPKTIPVSEEATQEPEEETQEFLNRAKSKSKKNHNHED